MRPSQLTNFRFQVLILRSVLHNHKRSIHYSTSNDKRLCVRSLACCIDEILLFVDCLPTALAHLFFQSQAVARSMTIAVRKKSKETMFGCNLTLCIGHTKSFPRERQRHQNPDKTGHHCCEKWVEYIIGDRKHIMTVFLLNLPASTRDQVFIQPKARRIPSALNASCCRRLGGKQEQQSEFEHAIGQYTHLETLEDVPLSSWLLLLSQGEVEQQY